MTDFGGCVQGIVEYWASDVWAVGRSGQFAECGADDGDAVGTLELTKDSEGLD